MPAETVTVVTGAASGIGRATVEHLTRIGGRVVAVDRSAESMNWLDMRSTCAVAGDVTDEATNDAAVAAAQERFGGLDAAFLNAGLSVSGPLETLDLARFEGGGGTLDVDDDVPVAELFDRVIARHERTLQHAGVRMRTTIEPGAERVRGDRDRLEQALQNLAANALRYAPADTAIELSAAKRGDHIVLTVADQGPGITPEHLPHVFDRFYKAEASRSIRSGPGQAGGSGLGLSIVKAIVERHGGTVAVASEPGLTVFSLLLPRREL